MNKPSFIVSLNFYDREDLKEKFSSMNFEERKRIIKKLKILFEKELARSVNSEV